jgi:hypothetical protein
MAHASSHKNLINTLIWLARNIARHGNLTQEEKVTLCSTIGTQALESLDDRVIADACGLYRVVLKDAEDHQIMQIVGSNYTLACLIKHMSNPDPNVHIEALRAFNNVLQY